MNLFLPFLGLLPWLIAYFFTGFVTPLSSDAYHLSAIFLFVGSVLAVYQAHRRHRLWPSLVFAVLGGSYFLWARFCFHTPDITTWSGGASIGIYSILPGVAVSILQVVLLAFLMVRWRPQLGLVLWTVHAAIDLAFSLAYFFGRLSMMGYHDYRRHMPGVPRFVTDLHDGFSSIGDLCAICGAVSIFLYMRQTRSPLPQA